MVQAIGVRLRGSLTGEGSWELEEFMLYSGDNVWHGLRGLEKGRALPAFIHTAQR
jgi:hypothetical protein